MTKTVNSAKTKVKKVKEEKVIGNENLKSEPIKEEPKHAEVKKEKEVAPQHGVLEIPTSEKKTEEKLEPLQPGQKYFEAPDGTIVIGEADRQQVWYRKLNGGKGGWINPKR